MMHDGIAACLRSLPTLVSVLLHHGSSDSVLYIAHELLLGLGGDIWA